MPGQLKFFQMTTPNAGDDVEKKELSFIAAEIQNGTATLEDSLAVSSKTTMLLLHDPAIALLGI